MKCLRAARNALWLGLWQLQCEQPLWWSKQIWQCNPLLLFCYVVFPILVKWAQHSPCLLWGMAWKVVLGLMAAHPWAIMLLVPWTCGRLGIDEWLSSPSSWFFVSITFLIEMLLAVLAQHDEVLCALLRQPVLWSDDSKAKSSDALFGKEVWIVVIVPYSEKAFLIYEWVQCFERTFGCNLFLFR